MVKFVRRVNAFFNGKTKAPSLYCMSIFNPLNIIPLRWLSRLFFVSSNFWKSIVVPIYSSSFLTSKLDCVPAVILPIIHDLIPVDHHATMRTWKENSSLVFEKLVQGISVHVNCPVTRVAFSSSAHLYASSSSSTTNNRSIFVFTPQGQVLEFDHVVFACNADAAADAMEGASFLERFLLKRVGYADDDDQSFLDGRIHMDASVLPPEHRDEILSSFANYIEVDHGNVQNTFVLSSWIPAVRAAAVKGPLLVTYNSKLLVKEVLGTVSNARCHPHMSLWNMIIAILLRLVQGRRGVYYCGSFATPGNGHDLSLLSGMVVAHALGAPYPFETQPAAADDFRRLRGLMGF